MKIRSRGKYLYRAVSDEELKDIREHGLRNKEGAYETGKLFAVRLNDAAKFGKNNFLFDGLCNTVIKAVVPVEIYLGSVKFEADGMVAVLIEKELLTLIKVSEFDYSPIFDL